MWPRSPPGCEWSGRGPSRAASAGEVVDRGAEVPGQFLEAGKDVDHTGTAGVLRGGFHRVERVGAQQRFVVAAGQVDAVSGRRAGVGKRAIVRRREAVEHDGCLVEWAQQGAGGTAWTQ